MASDMHTVALNLGDLVSDVSGHFLHSHHPKTIFTQTNLVSDGSSTSPQAAHTDGNLVNPWGVSFSPTSPFWVSDNAKGVATLYDGNGVAQPLVVTIATPNGQMPGTAPTGQVFNTDSDDFDISAKGGTPQSSVFLFATEDGTISGWNPKVDPTHSALLADNSSNPAEGADGNGAVYKGLAIGKGEGDTHLFAANFRHGTVDVFDGSETNGQLNQVGSITDPNVPAGFAPFNVQVLDGHLFVTYAMQDGPKHDDVAGKGHGFVDEYDLDGHLLHRVASGGPLDSPWGLAIAPSDFGKFAGDLLVGNFGDGTINAYDLKNDHFVGKLDGADGKPIVIGDLWAITPGNGHGAGDPGKLYFTAGVEKEAQGLFGSLTPSS